jgi:hypothetical protein
MQAQLNYGQINMSIQNNYSNGYIALASILVIAAVVLVIGISTSLLSVNEAQSSLAGLKNEATVDFVEGCIEDALIRLNEDETIPSQISLPEGTCEITNQSTIGNTWTFTASGSVDTHTKTITVEAIRDSSVSIASWKEN